MEVKRRPSRGNREVRVIAADDQDVRREAEIYVTGLAGFLLAKTAAAYSRREQKDWYDIAYVLLNNDYGDPVAARRAWHVFGTSIAPAGSALRDLKANFADSATQGTSAYAGQVSLDHPGEDQPTAAADSQLAVQAFCEYLLSRLGRRDAS